MSQTSPQPAAQALWNIAEIERDTGLGKDALRVWERRYGFPQPLRDARGDRLYDQQQLERLRLIKQLLDAGHRPGQVVPLPRQQLENLQQAHPGATEGTNLALAGWRDLLMAGNPAELRAALRRNLGQLGLARAIEELFAPLGRDIGAAWLAGELSIHQEHLYTEALQAVLRDALAVLDSDSAQGGKTPRVLLTTLPQEQHQLGLLMAESYFALEQCERISLGIGMPLPEIVAAAARYQADIVALSISPYAAAREVSEQLSRLRDQLPAEVELWIGGGWTEARRRRLPAGLHCVSRAAQVGAELARWRAAHRATEHLP